MRYARTQALFSARSSGTAASNFLRTTKRPRKTEAFHIKPTPRARDYSQAVSDLNLRVRTVADRHSVRKSVRSSSENYQRKQGADGTVRWTRERRWKQSWTLQGLSKPISLTLMLRCDAHNLGIPDAKLNHRFCMTAIFLLHCGMSPVRDEMSQLSPVGSNTWWYLKTIEKGRCSTPAFQCEVV